MMNVEQYLYLIGRIKDAARRSLEHTLGYGEAMNDETKIQPALTPEEWREGRDMGAQQWYMSREDGVVDVRCDDPSDWQALAAIALHGQPFGFTWDDVDEVRDAAGLVHEREEVYGGDGDKASRNLYDLADRIADLLPPRELNARNVDP